MQKPVILFDGECNLCSRSVQFIIKRDPRARFRFAALQSPAGQRLLEACGADARGADSVVLLEGASCYTRSDAALRAKRAGFDIVYIYAAHDLSLAMHFLQQRRNQRGDEYGGSLENRVQGLERGADDYNLRLTQARAESVVAYLVEKGVAPARLVARGYGETRPLALGHDDEAWSKNRRVEFVIVR